MDKKLIALCMALAVSLCLAQVLGSTVLIIACLVSYLLIVGWSCYHDQTLPVLLFFLPWSPLLRLSQDSYSFYTFGMVLCCCIRLVRNHLRFKNYAVISGVILMLITLVSKLMDASGLTFDYIAFMMMIVVFPVMQEEGKKQKYDFYKLVIFLSLGVIVASLCAMYFAEYANIRRFIRVDKYSTIIRRSGFYGDANFYAAQILAALAGTLYLTLEEKNRKRMVFLIAIIIVLLYCGFLSGSKSFALIAAMALLIWVVAILRMRGRRGTKFVLLACLVGAAAYIASSALFGGLIDVLVTRFLRTEDFDSFTTGRMTLWQIYMDELFGNIKVFFLGHGFTNVMINERASHSTVIQIFYQFGLLGVPVLIYWIISFFRINTQGANVGKVFSLRYLMIYAGVFGPWLALDLLFFDEFFLLQWYVLVALTNQGEPPKTETTDNRLRSKAYDSA